MRRDLAWGLGAVGGLAALGGAVGGTLWAASPSVLATAGGTAAVGGAWFAVATFVGPALGLQLYRRGFAPSTAVSAAAAGAGVLAFEAAPLALALVTGVPLEGLRLVRGLVLEPLAAAGVAAAGARFLARGVRSYRAKHGIGQAPR